jgi:hypothetical protein
VRHNIGRVLCLTLLALLAQPAFVQGSDGVDVSGSVDVPFTSPSARGNTIIVASSWYDGGVPLSVTDSAGNLYQPATVLMDFNTVWLVQVFYATQIDAGPAPITIHCASGTYLDCAAIEYSGLGFATVSGFSASSGLHANLGLGVTVRDPNTVLVSWTGSNGTVSRTVDAGDFALRSTVDGELLLDAVAPPLGPHDLVVFGDMTQLVAFSPGDAGSPPDAGAPTSDAGISISDGGIGQRIERVDCGCSQVSGSMLLLLISATRAGRSRRARARAGTLSESR